MATEEERALEHRRALAAREAHRIAAERRLAGSPGAFAAFRRRWLPWLTPQPTVVEPRDSDLTNF